MVRLIYWNKRGRAEQVRLLLHELGVEYEDAFITRRELAETNDRDPGHFTFGSVPMLEDGAFRLSQGPAILGYLARQHGRVPGGLEVGARADSIVLGAEDLRILYFELFGPEGPSLQKAFVEGPLKRRWLPAFERLLRENGGGDWFSGNTLNHADIAVWDVLDSLLTWVEGASLDGYPRLRDFFDGVRVRPGIAAYLGSPRRPTG